MKHIVTWCEIPVTNMERAESFYKGVFGFNIQHADIEGFKYAMFEADEETISGALILGDGYNPSSDGTVVYLNGGDDLNNVLDKVKESGNQILIPKTPIGEDKGFFAHFLDTEGNKIGLYSMK